MFFDSYPFSLPYQWFFVLYLYVYVIKFLLSLMSKNIMWTFLLHAARKLTGKHDFF